MLRSRPFAYAAFSLLLLFAPYASAYDAVDIALEQLGDKYILGHEGPSTFDCSGLTQYAFGHVGIWLPRRAVEQSRVGEIVTTDINDISKLRRGDLLFFANSSAEAKLGIVGHVGIYLSGTQMINAYYDDVVRVEDDFTKQVAPTWWRNLFISARRLLPSGASTKFAVGDDVEVTEDGANIRDQSDDWKSVIFGGQPAKTIKGTQGRILSRPIFAIDHWFWHVDFESGADGWVAEEFLKKLGVSEFVVQPGPAQSKDVWTTSVFCYCPGPSRGPGGGLNDEWLRVGGWGDLYYSLIEFKLDGLPAQASSARIELFTPQLIGNGPTPMILDRITAFWDWKTQGTGEDRERLWWADRPPAVQWSGVLPAPQVGQWYSIDITDLYNAWKNGTYPNYGVQLRPLFNNNNWSQFYSSEFAGDPSLRPKLVVVPQ